MKKFRLEGWLLATALILSACGGGSSSSITEGKTSPTEAATNISFDEGVSPTPTAETKAHSADAFVLGEGDASRKLTEKVPGIREISNATKTARAHAQVGAIDLGQVSSADLSVREQNNQKNAYTGRAKAYQIGVNRPIAVATQTKNFQQLLKWTTSLNGRAIGSTSFSSTDAAGIRLGVLVKFLPNGAVVRTFGSGETLTLEVDGEHINRTVAANVQADGDSINARTYWLPLTSGSVSHLEIELPAGVDANSLAISVPSLVHSLQSAPSASIAELKQKSDCPNINPDAMCSVPLPPAANAVGSYDFVLNGIEYVCTGTLIADKASTATPFFLTANHCIPDQTSASTIIPYWFWRSSACNSGTVNPNYIKTYGGATMRYTKNEQTINTRNPVGTDTTLVSLNSPPPNGVMYVGWTNDRQAISSSVSLTALHNPLGELLRQSTGVVSGMGVVNSAGTLGPTNDPSQPMYQTTWSAGITEGGSSGSGLFVDGTTANPKIVGQLWGGASSCTAPSNPDFYGRFDLAYQNGMIDWLNPGYKMVFRFFNSSNGAHFFSASVDERNNVRNTNLALNYEGPVFSVVSGPGTGLSPVYRFYNTRNGAHFYTISESERANVLATAPWYQLEGVAWYARQNANPGAGSIPVYRFYVKSLGTHLYTVSASERDYIIQNLSSNYNYEGVAYQAWAPT